MKKFYYIAIASLIVLMTGCDKESYRHAIGIVYPAGGNIVYADQVEDSVVFYTFDSYEVTPTSDWIQTNYKYAEPKKKFANAYYYSWMFRVGLDIAPNMDGKCRYGFVSVQSQGDDGWSQTVGTAFYQYAWHNIGKPYPKYRITNEMPDSASFALRVAATCEADTLLFTTYQDWKLEVPAESFVHPVSVSGKAGAQVVRLEFDENTKTEPDSVELKLVTPEFGITTPILIHRKGLEAGK